MAWPIRFPRGAAALTRGLVALGALLLLASCAGTSGGGGSSARMPIEDPDAEIAASRARLAVDSTDTEAWFRLARSWEAKAMVDSALVAYDELVRIDPDGVEGVVHRGLALEDARRPDEALEAYLTATTLAPDDPRPWVNLGTLQYFHYKRTFEAKVALTRALKADPDNPEAHFNLGVLFADANMYREAMIEWEAVLEHAPEGPARNLAAEHLEDIRPLVEEMSAGS